MRPHPSGKGPPITCPAFIVLLVQLIKLFQVILLEDGWPAHGLRRAQRRLRGAGSWEPLEPGERRRRGLISASAVAPQPNGFWSLH